MPGFSPFFILFHVTFIPLIFYQKIMKKNMSKIEKRIIQLIPINPTLRFLKSRFAVFASDHFFLFILKTKADTV